jgi:hypothetical protein
VGREGRWGDAHDFLKSTVFFLGHFKTQVLVSIHLQLLCSYHEEYPIGQVSCIVANHACHEAAVLFPFVCPLCLTLLLGANFSNKSFAEYASPSTFQLRHVIMKHELSIKRKNDFKL